MTLLLNVTPFLSFSFFFLFVKTVHRSMNYLSSREMIQTGRLLFAIILACNILNVSFKIFVL